MSNEWLHRTFIEVQEQEQLMRKSLDNLTDAQLLSWLCSRWSELTMRVQANLIERLTFVTCLNVQWHTRGVLLYRYAREGGLPQLVNGAKVELTKAQRRSYRKWAAIIVSREAVKKPTTQYVRNPPSGSVRPCELRKDAVKTEERKISVLFYCGGKLLSKSEVGVSEMKEKLPLARTWALKDKSRSVVVRGEKETLTIHEACRRIGK